MLIDNRQKKIGITGSIGAGKTFISNIFINLGIPVFNADFEAKKYMVENKILKQEIKGVFGDTVYENGILQNKLLAEIVFNNKYKLEKLNNLVHPIVKKGFDDWCYRQESKIIIKEAAILFESNSYLDLDKIICVSAPKDIRIDRVINRDNISREQVIARMEKQMVQEEKEKLSNFIIVNDEKELLLPQILNIIAQIK